jgi:hypothetical protein
MMSGRAACHGPLALELVQPQARDEGAMRFAPGAHAVLCELGRVFFAEAFRGPATVFADKAVVAPAVAGFSVHMPVKASRTVRARVAPSPRSGGGMVLVRSHPADAPA